MLLIFIKKSSLFIKIFITILVISLLASCAIHKEFPFICFKKECIKAQFSRPGRQLAGGKKGFKQNASSKKRKKKKKKKNKKADNPSIHKKDKSKLDSLNLDGNIGKSTIKIVFYYKIDSSEITIKSDSVYLKTPPFTLTKSDQIAIKSYLDKYLIKNITEIYISPTILLENANSTKNNKRSSMKIKRIEQYLIKSRIKKSNLKIKTE